MWFFSGREKLYSDGAPLGSRRIGIIAGSSSFPLLFAQAAAEKGYSVVAAAHVGETKPAIRGVVNRLRWFRVGEVGAIIDFFRENQINEIVLAGGINRIRLFGGVKLDARGAKLIARLRSLKDDVIMRGLADELKDEGIEVVECTRFMESHLAPEGLISSRSPTPEEQRDIQVGIEAIKAMSSQDIGQTVVVRDGVIVAVEAVEGTDRTIQRGGKLGGKGIVVVKFSKTTQDLRFDVPTVGKKTLEILSSAGATALAIEAGRTLVLDQEEVIKLANRHKISIVGVPALERSERGRLYIN
jgi:DUF1009 family protein